MTFQQGTGQATQPVALKQPNSHPQLVPNPNLGAVLSDLWVRPLDLVGGDEALNALENAASAGRVVDPTPEERQEMRTTDAGATGTTAGHNGSDPAF